MACPTGNARRRLERGAVAAAVPAAPTVQLRMEPVAYRSAAWRELWRRIFEAIAEDFALGNTTAGTGPRSNEPSGVLPEPRS